MELWAIALGFIILLFFIEIVGRLESEWKVKWESLEGIIDQPHLNNRLHGDHVENGEQVNITPDFDPILNKLVAESSSQMAPIQRVQQILAAPPPPTPSSMPALAPTASQPPPPPPAPVHEVERPLAPIPKGVGSTVIE